ncbi:MAG: alpha-amylase family glycosyl hydrolase [Saccharofermentanales bacterium]
MMTKSMINNSDLLPAYKADSDVLYDGPSPEWLKDLVMMQFRIETSNEAHSFEGAVSVLDHLRETGVNGVWINPVFQKPGWERSGNNNGYNTSDHTRIDEVIAGTADKEQGFEAAKKFVDEAHNRDIRIFFDITIWGCTKDSPWLVSNPEYFQKKEDGTFVETWGGYAYNWFAPQFREWYIQNAVDIIVKTGADGFRCDLEPDITAYALWKEVKNRLQRLGRKVVLIAECGCTEEEYSFDFQQGCMGLDDDWDEKTYTDTNQTDYFYRNNIVDCIRSGKGHGKASEQKLKRSGMQKYYCHNLCCHDHYGPVIKGDRVKIGYQAIFAPYIPCWYIGEEWNNPKEFINGDGVMYFNRINWEEKEKAENAAFFEDVKAMIRIRRTYPEIFHYYATNHRNSNICKIYANDTILQAYGRYADGKGVMILPNIFNETRTIPVRIPFDDMKIAAADVYELVDLYSGKILMTGSRKELYKVDLALRPGFVEAVMVRPRQ